jgi:hypothetical protein
MSNNTKDKTLTRLMAREIAQAYGINWNLDVKWQEAWFRNFENMIFNNFRGCAEHLVHNAAMQFIEDATDKKPPPFGVFKSFLDGKVGAWTLEDKLEQTKCSLCDKGVRRMLIVFSKEDEKLHRRELVCRCTCAVGAMNRTVLNTEQLRMKIKNVGFASRLFGFSDLHDIKIEHVHVTVYSEEKQASYYQGSVDAEIRLPLYHIDDPYDPYRWAGYTSGEIERHYRTTAPAKSAAAIAAQKQRFRSIISRGKY